MNTSNSWKAEECIIRKIKIVNNENKAVKTICGMIGSPVIIPDNSWKAEECISRKKKKSQEEQEGYSKQF